MKEEARARAAERFYGQGQQANQEHAIQGEHQGDAVPIDEELPPPPEIFMPNADFIQRANEAFAFQQRQAEPVLSPEAAISQDKELASISTDENDEQPNDEYVYALIACYI